MARKIEKNDAEWRAQLGAEAYEVTRRKATERPFSGEYWDTKTPGEYRCRCCGELLFLSEHKFDAGCGWPSFYAGAAPGAIDEASDHSHGMVRTEILCSNCGAHLGHVFPDGPRPTGLRYCVNSLSLTLKERKT